MTTNLIFDLDDTLLDFTASELHGLQRVFVQYGIPYTDETQRTYQQINTHLWNELARGHVTREQIFARRFATFLDAIGRDPAPAHDMEAAYRVELNHGYDRVPGAKTLLIDLHQHGFRILAGTNGLATTQHQRLQHSHLGPLFDGVFISQEIGFDKPSHQFFDAIFAAEPQATRQNTIMIGDGLNSDIRGGINYGLRTVWVNLHGQQNTTPLHPTREVHSLPELDQILVQSA
ncbi:YjjG family noncanonical pyrimidine nucleotidase [Lacticaseibacillus thailandensis]|uniref:HAD superfamily phosphatase n=1 Tax=Lacticaseibacillus thailandensis DSM 22698 = JCM 13996 TaxID=1423810 RepID=A0A0R2C6Q3_9LACO|nr:YjjG family noncanonical pyrimidine nucleotidase [Lacticaseibacillus thailandensis]KRM87390.1 HAD superfamily phosphatase [Lacticaseibacillus thailandensis DSM 22698 = JCM 13996]